MNKRGFLRIIEAVVAIVIIISVMFVYFNKQKAQIDEDYTERAVEILEEMSRNVTLREIVIDYNANSGDPIPLPIENFVQSRIFENFLDTEIRICEVDSSCGKKEFVDAEVFSAERTISSTIYRYEPKKVRLFIWRNP